MPVIIEELIAFFAEAKESESLLDFLKLQGKKYTDKKVKKLKSVLRKFTPAKDKKLKKRLGEKVHAHIKKELNITNKTSIRVDTPNSSWVQYIEWVAGVGIGKLKTKKSNKVYLLPFFPRSIVTMVQKGASAGKTIWRKYWRVVGKGSVTNKTRNLIRVRLAKKIIKVTNKRLPVVKVVKNTPKKSFNKNLIGRALVKTSNIPKTGAKGIKINIKAPRIRKY